MGVQFTNGAVVHRIWPKSQSELIAYFQYENEALVFAEAMKERDKGRDYATPYTVTCTYSGKQTYLSPEEKAQGN